MNQPLVFQTIMMTLQRFCAEQGCLIWQPYYTQVGAGTYNPATYLRVLGPEPWNVGYVEPSIRPDDGRYGENPNRLQHYYQFQVILKPDPGNPQEIYLKSLEALGIDPRQHDIRFVEDNWESPALGAWGLGWEVWLDGQEITQFTYFQQAGGILLDPVSVEITYGLERIAMALQKVRNFRDLHWSVDRTYGDVNLQGEIEHSKYYFEMADVERQRQLYDIYRVEALNALEKGLVLPAHDYVLKCSHTFNILDTRGAIGVTERQAFFAKMRDLSRSVAEAYLAQRQTMEFPWGEKNSLALARQAGGMAQEKPVVSLPVLQNAAHFLVEIGTEELPASDLESALGHLTERVPAWLDELRLTHGDVKILGTPRRLVLWVKDLAPIQPDRETVVKGPPANRAFDAQGQPTKAAEGFARGKGVTVTDLEVREIEGGQYVVAVIQETGRPSAQVLAEALPGWIASLKFDKAMRWNTSNTAFSRPIRWLLALFGGQVVPFEYAGLIAGNRTRGLRFLQPEEMEVNDPQAYFDYLKSHGILLDPSERRQAIAGQNRRLMAEIGAVDQVDDQLLDEVTQLVEAPTALVGKFEESHLRLPSEVLTSVMKKHQRYFPTYGKNGELLPYFIVVRNGDDRYLDVVADGNAQVVRARFADAAFFVEEDLRHKLEDMLPRLGTLTFQFKLGSMLDKTQRIEALVEKLIPLVRLNEHDAKVARRAAHLCKADLVSHMVIEMTSLQGVMGRHYAMASGEVEDVANAIFEHYLPRSAEDSLPASKAGQVIGLADRLDTLAGLFAAGLAPSGTKDPFAQRRAAITLVQSLGKLNIDFDLRQGLSLAAESLPVAAAPEVLAACYEFIVGRMRAYLLEMTEGYRYDVVEAILAVQAANPAGVFRAVQTLGEWVARPDWNTILPAYARCVRITRDLGEQFAIRPEAITDPADRAFLDALRTAQSSDRRPGSVEDCLTAFMPLIPAINQFFEAVLVMAEDPQTRANRLGMLQQVAALTQGTADFSKLEGF